MAQVKIRDSALNALKRYLQVSKCDARELDVEAIQTHMELLDEQWRRFCGAQQEVEILCGEECAAMEEQSRIQAEEWYHVARSNFKRLGNAYAQCNSPNQPVVVSAAVQLPKLQLPTFNGDATAWLCFHDAFQSLVHTNANLTDGQRLHYLRGCLTGEPLQLISSLAIRDANYKEAWSLLTARYKVMRVIVDSHFKAIFGIEKTTKDSGKSIKQVLNATLQHVGALRALGRPVDFWDDWLVHLTVSKLAFETRKQWELSLINDQLPTFDELREFLETRARSLEMLPTAVAISTTSSGSNPSTKRGMHVLHAIGEPEKLEPNPSSNASVCTYCMANHKIYVCPRFGQLDVATRFAAIKRLGACLNCLSKGHLQSKCRSASSCHICHRRHHTLLHSSRPAPNVSTEPLNAHATPFAPQPEAAASLCTFAAKSATNQASTASMSTAAVPSSVTAAEIAVTTAERIISHQVNADRAILLATAQIFVQDHTGRRQPARALFDNGSHASFVTEACVQRLRLPRKSSSVYVTGIGSLQGGKVKGEATLHLLSRSSEQRMCIDALILPKITNDRPTVNVQMLLSPPLDELFLADPNYATPGPIDLLIGMDEMDKFLLPGFHKGPPGSPMAQNTAFGWVLFGNATRSPSPITTVSSLHCDAQLVRMVGKFWELEELPPRKHLTAEEKLCEDHFHKTCRRAKDGRYIVRLPLKAAASLGESRTAAVRSLLRMEKRFSVNEQLRVQYSAFMQELLDMGHMELVRDIPPNAYYMPHHAVEKATSSTTKLRVVFNASMKTSTGNSLNDVLMVGPQIQQDLFSILVRFRTHRYAITGDIEKMYRQVYVAKEDVDYQRIVWREAPTDPISDYRLLRVTYGVAAASHLAIKTLHQISADASNAYPEAATVITRDFYMDDLLTGASSVKGLAALQKDVSHVLSGGGFQLRKWATNCSNLRSKIPHASKQISHLLADGHEIRTLGIIWNTDDDSLSIAVNLKELPPTLTKRVYLSDSSMIFDPLGLISPCTIRTKIWLQQLWRNDVDWDEPVPPDVVTQWLAHRRELPKLSSLRLSRWLGTERTSICNEFHVFTDASERAYAAAMYCRTLHPNGDTEVVLIAARTKVAPLRNHSLPRLELCAAHLGAKLVRQVQSSLGFDIEEMYAWTDSTITLAWLQGHPSRWSTFVANRVAEVQEVLPSELWRHVRSEHNPADCASRGTTPSQLLTHSLWWQGPHWLRNAKCEWRHQVPQHTTELELKTRNLTANVAQTLDCWDLLTRYSTYAKLRRVTAYIRRFVSNIRAKSKTATTSTGPLNYIELKDAELALIRANKPIPLRSSLLRLQPFLDGDGLLRVGGRIKNATIADYTKHPIILPKGTPLAYLIVTDIHRDTLHSGPQIMQVTLQRRFWVISSRNLVRKIYRNCVKCKRWNAISRQQSMADLPRCRTIYSRCFLRSAVDFAGPFDYKFAPGRGSKSTKGYICSFICMCTGAMHLEFAGDLSSDTFLGTFKRFVNRRGYCEHMYSDNGTNFVGADKTIRLMFDQCIADPTVSSYFADTGVTWHFNPPNAPHMGGYWETGIKRVKYHLKRALGESLLTFEGFSTLLTEIEACVNSRPLCVNVSDPTDFEILTPGHFIIGEPLKGLPEPDAEVFSGTLQQRWRAITIMRQHFWHRWRDEYLVSLQRRSKWFRQSPNLLEGDVVILMDERTPPTKWKLARVSKCYPGKDGLVRVVRVKTADGEFLRPVTKLCRLPTEQDVFQC